MRFAFVTTRRTEPARFSRAGSGVCGRIAGLVLICLASLGLSIRAVAADAEDEMGALQSQFIEYFDAGRYEQAEPLGRRMLALAEKRAANEPSEELTASLTNLARLYQAQGRYAEAEPLYLRSLKLTEQAFGPNHPNVAVALTDLGMARTARGNYPEADQAFRKSVAICEKALGPDHEELAFNFNNLGDLSIARGRYAEAEAYFQKALRIYQRQPSADRSAVPACLNNLAFLYRQQGKYADSERLYEQVLAMDGERLGKTHRNYGLDLNNLANLYIAQGRYADAEPVCLQSRKILESTLGPRHPKLAFPLNNLGMVYLNQNRPAEAEPLFEQALAIRRQAFGKDHPLVALSLESLAREEMARRHFDRADALLQESLDMRERTLGPSHPDVANALIRLAELREVQGRTADSEPLADRAISILDRAHANLDLRFSGYYLRARLSWELGRKKEAVRDLQEALSLAEQQRGRVGGGEHERAQQFLRFGSAFERMVAWQTEIGDPTEALAAIEKSRARSLLDEINLAGADLSLGRSSAEREQLNRREAEIRSRVADLEGQLKSVATANDTASGLRRIKLEQELADAREKLYAAHRDERSSSPVYQNLLTVGSAPPRLSQLQRRLLGGNGLALIYLFGENGGYVLILTGDQARLVSLSVDARAAQTFGTSAGPLTVARLQEMLIGRENRGIVPQLAHKPGQGEPQLDPNLISRLETLSSVLIPETERNELTTGKFERLIIVPDGPLALFPFETLIVQGGENPEFLLDNGPAILYSPSTSVLYNLADRAVAAAGTRKPVLTVADPVYPQEKENQLAARDRSAPLQLTSRSRYAGVGGQLTRLPFTGSEAQAVSDAFTKVGTATGKLERDQATEEIVRFNVSGRKIVHLACHGLTDQAYGNFFGALALTPGSQGAANPLDDGFLTLSEIYDLDLKGCELAILSACETNYGPQQQGEGTWALSRGFLVAGARRVVASNWLVDDEAAASLIGGFCNGLAQNEKSGGAVNHAAQLQAAKKFIRNQDKWRSPYYWSTFVLVGPN